MKFIRFNLSRGDTMTFPSEEAKRILTSPEQLVPIKEADGKWHGRTINKAHIVSTTWDEDREAEERDFSRIEENNKKLLEIRP